MRFIDRASRTPQTKEAGVAIGRDRLMLRGIRQHLDEYNRVLFASNDSFYRQFPTPTVTFNLCDESRRQCQRQGEVGEGSECWIWRGQTLALEEGCLVYTRT
jgi:hypothetical protein